MGTELTITKELASLCATASEWNALAGTINALIRKGDFHITFNRMIAELGQTYSVLLQLVQPFAELEQESAFNERFDALFEQYRGCYLHAVSRPRKHADESYEIYLLLRQMPEIRTGYPMLKRTFARLDEFIDKWVTNDAWLVMSIDTTLKMLNRLLTEIAEVKRGDSEEAFLLYNLAFTEFSEYLRLLERKRQAFM